MSIAIDLQEWQAAAPMTHAQLVGVELPRDDITQRLIQLLSEVSELLLRGLHRRYVRREEVLTSPRGRISLQTIARQGGIVQASLPCIHHPRLEDCLINQ